MERDEKTLWNQKYGERSHTSLEPDPFLISGYSEFIGESTPGSALDVAGGTGRHTLWLAERGWNVTLVDVSEVGIDLARRNLAQLHSKEQISAVEFKVLDLERIRDLGHEQYDLVLVFFYLQRELFPALISALRPRGFLIYKTYTIDQQRFPGGPSHPMHMLQPNELLRAFSALRILYYHENLRQKGVAELLARKG